MVAGPCYSVAVHVTLSVPAYNDRGPQYMEQALAAIHQANPHRLPLTLELSCQEKMVTLGVRLPADLTTIAMRQFAANYPDCSMEVVSEKNADEPDDKLVWSLDLWLRPYIFSHPAVRPIRGRPEPQLLRSPDWAFGRIDAGRTWCFTFSHRNDRQARSTAPHKRARKAVRRLAASFFRAHPAMARSYALAATSRFLPARFFTALLGAFATSHIFAAHETPRQSPSPIVTTARMTCRPLPTNCHDTFLKFA